MQLDKDAFRFGFSIGAGGSEQLKRLARSCHDNSATLERRLGELLSTLPVIFGDDEGDGSSLSEPGQAALGSEAGCRASKAPGRMRESDLTGPKCWLCEKMSLPFANRRHVQPALSSGSLGGT